jgi:uncharacterized protein DUF5675
MLITVDRYLSNSDATLSRISVDGDFICYGLEDGYREEKVYGETRITAGEYEITLRTEGGFHKRYSEDERFDKKFHKGMLWVRDVPDFEFILIHIGNFVRDTLGCLLVGERRDETSFQVIRSVSAYKKLYAKVVKAAKSGDLRIHYIDNDR